MALCMLTRVKMNGNTVILVCRNIFMSSLRNVPLHVPIEFLEMLENWLCDSQACVKWNSLWSYVFQINFGVRQGSVLSPVLFAIYVDDVARCCKNERYLHIILYADDILLLAPSVT